MIWYMSKDKKRYPNGFEVEMTDTDEFLKKGHEASFFNDLIKRVSLEAEKQFSDFAMKAEPCFGNEPYWQMPTDEPVVKIERLADQLMDMLYEEESTAHEVLQSIRDCKKKAEEIIVQALLAYICVGTHESEIIDCINNKSDCD